MSSSTHGLSICDGNISMSVHSPRDADQPYTSEQSISKVTRWLELLCNDIGVQFESPFSRFAPGKRPVQISVYQTARKVRRTTANCSSGNTVLGAWNAIARLGNTHVKNFFGSRALDFTDTTLGIRTAVTCGRRECHSYVEIVGILTSSKCLQFLGARNP